MSKTCFVVCPIGEEGTDIRKNSNKLLNHILKPICEKNGFNCIRVDELNDSNSLTDTIINYLKEADLVIADLTGHNPNAFFELGYRTALNKHTIHLKQKNDTIPFDVSAIRTFSYDLTDLDSVEEVKGRIDKTIQNMNFEYQTSELQEIKPNATNEQDSSQILDELFKIQDKLDSISNVLKQNNETAISVLADKLSNTQKSPQALLIESLFEKPESVLQMIEISQKIQDLKFDNNSDNISVKKS